MNEQISSVEAEDVLSSIKRLVSEEKQPKARAPRKSSKAKPAAEKLILTPSLRIDPPVADKPETGVAAMEAVIAALAEAIKDEGAAAERPENKIVALPSRTGRLTLVPDAEPVVVPEAPFVEAVDVALDGLVAGHGGHVERGEADAIAADVIPFERGQASAALPPANDAVAEALAAVLVEQTPDLGAPSEAAPERQEDMLRDIVRQVLREELQGEFGERITRNVRKLVRAEIARALLSRGIE